VATICVHLSCKSVFVPAFSRNKTASAFIDFREENPAYCVLLKPDFRLSEVYKASQSNRSLGEKAELFLAGCQIR
jgi:hypothetical protein